MNFRGRYPGGASVVTAKRWWWPPDRKRARLAARVLEYEWADCVRRRVARDQAESVRAFLFGSSVSKPTWEPPSGP